MPEPTLTPNYGSLDQALTLLADYGPEYGGGLTGHGPMMAEALCALGRGDAVLPMTQRYADHLSPAPPAGQPFPDTEWRPLLGKFTRYGDWVALMEQELAAAPWREVLDRWVARLAPGYASAAVHGVIRVGHAVRSLGQDVPGETETPARLKELAAALGYWAARYHELPTAPRDGTMALPAKQAFEALALRPMDERPDMGLIVSSLLALKDFPPFHSAIWRLDVSGEPDQLLDELMAVFTGAFLANAHDTLPAIIFTHGVTGVAALRNLAPYLSKETLDLVAPYAWQAGAGLYAALGTETHLPDAVEPPSESPQALMDWAIAGGDEHGIKLLEACLTQYRRTPNPLYLAAARRGLEALNPEAAP